MNKTPPLIGRWHHGNGVLVCGTIRIATEDIDTLPCEEVKEALFDWMCKTLNEGSAQARASAQDNIEGVPNATYLVKGGRVFVFDKLVKLVEERQSDLPLDELARSLIAEATVSAKEAVETWGVVPEPYKLVELPDNSWMIYHRPFNARLPGIFRSKDEARDTFIHLLLGGIHAGNGDFAYRGQPMFLCDPLDTTQLPSRPVIQRVEDSELARPPLPPMFLRGDESGQLGYVALRGLSYESGFDPVSEALFDDAKELEATWRNDSTRAARYAQDHAGDIWARAATLRLDALNDPTDEVPEYGQGDSAELRLLYPELAMLADGSLYAWFDVYQAECCFLNGWEANRDDDFLFYLLGQVAGSQYEQDTAKEVGRWAAYALLRGDSLDAALAFGRAAALYDSAISRLARRIADAMQFVAADKSATERRGGSITTMRDVFRMSRSCGFSPVLAEQKTTDFK